MLTDGFEWNALSTRQLRKVWELVDRFKDSKAQRNLAVWMYLNRLEVVKNEGEVCDDGEWKFYFRNQRSLLDRIKWWGEETWHAIRADDLEFMLGGFHPGEDVDTRIKAFEAKGAMDFLDDPFHLTVFPEEFIKVGGVTFKCPDQDMTSLSWQQYGNVQKLMQAYWQVGDALQKATASDEELTEERIKALSEQAKMLEDFKAQFLAHLFTSSRIQFFSTNGGGIRWDPGKDYSYSPVRAESHKKTMRKAPDWLFTIAYQWMQSCQVLMRKMFPDLYTSTSKTDKRAPIVAEIDTINAIMKWEGTYPTQQDVYDTNAVFILGNLKDMTKESNEIEKMNSKIKKK